MIHIFFSVHLTIYRSAKSQPSSLRLELMSAAFQTHPIGQVFASSLLISLNIQTPVNLTARFGLTFRANLRNIQTKVHIFLKWIQQKIIFTLKHGNLYLIQYIFKHDLDVLQGNFKLVKTLVLFCLLHHAAVAAN